jgi:hypothetical protein
VRNVNYLEDLLKTMMRLELIEKFYVAQDSNRDDKWYVYIKVFPTLRGRRLHELPSWIKI